jgi:Immunoglobulin-like domain of bacterial spore germination
MSTTLPEGSPSPTRPEAAGPRSPTGPPPPGRDRRVRWLVVALVTAMAVIVGLIVALAWPNDDEGATTAPSTTAPTTVVTTAPSTTAPATVTTAPSATAPVDTTTAVFPSGAAAHRYTDPVDAARAFAIDYAGFTDPLVGAFQQGDTRSGEVPVRPFAQGPVTTVLLRQLGTDGSWWVLGSATADIAVTAPGAGDTVSSPLTVRGRALAFEVNVEVRQDGSTAALGTTAVTGGGDVMRPFSGTVTFQRPTERHGAVLFRTFSAKDGQVLQAGVIRVAFAS